MDRRQLLLTSGTGLAAALSGCSALSGGSDGESDESTDESAADDTATDTPTGPATFEELSLAVDDGAQVDSEVTLTVSATNVGGETGTYEGTVQLAASDETTETDDSGDASFESPFAIESVAPDETGETTITGPAFETVDDYEFVVADTDASVTVRPEPVTAEVGETLSIGADLVVSVDDVSVRESIFYPTRRSSGLSTYEEISAFGAPSEHVLAIITVTAENTGTETTTAERGTIGISDADWYSDGEGAPDTILGRSDDRFYGGGLPEIEPSESATGYFLASVPRETVRGTIEVTGQVDSTGTLPERVWTAAPDGEERSLPRLTLESVDAPETAPLGRDHEITITVANEGDAAGTLRAVTQWDDDGDWAQLTSTTSVADLSTDRPTGGVIRQDIDAGGSTELTLSNYSVYDGQYSYRLQPFGEEWQIDFEEATLGFGDTLQSNGNANIVVSDLRLADTVTAYDDWSEEEFEAEPDDGNQFVAVQFRFSKRNQSADYVSTPDTSDFSLLADGITASDSTYIDGTVREDWFTPIEGELEDQPEISGWYFYEVPVEYAASDLAVHYEYSPGFGSSVSTVATWE